MGNSNGTLADTWAAIEATPGLQGGFIWEFWDHGILQHVNDGRPAGRGGTGLYENGVAGPGLRWAYGGDFGETIHDGAFIADGVVFPDRTPKPVMFEHREIAAPVRLSVEGEGTWRVLRVHNRQHFRDLSWLAAEWEFAAADGGTWTLPARLPDVPPGGSAVHRPARGGGRGGRDLADAAGDDGRRRALGTARHRGVPAAGPVVRGGRGRAGGGRRGGPRAHPAAGDRRGRAAAAPAARLPARLEPVAGPDRQRRPRRDGRALARTGPGPRRARAGRRGAQGVDRAGPVPVDDGCRGRRARAGVHGAGGRPGARRGDGRPARGADGRGPCRHGVRDRRRLRPPRLVRAGPLGELPGPCGRCARRPPLGPRRRAVHPLSATAGERGPARRTALHALRRRRTSCRYGWTDPARSRSPATARRTSPPPRTTTNWRPGRAAWSTSTRRTGDWAPPRADPTPRPRISSRRASTAGHGR